MALWVPRACLLSITDKLQVTLEISAGPSGPKPVSEKPETPTSDVV
jgi:hypothetical protein